MNHRGLRFRLQPVLLAVVFSFTAFAVDAAPVVTPTSGDSDVASAPLPFGIGPEPVRAAYCATPNPSFQGYLTQSLIEPGTPTAAGRITTGNVYGYISNVVDDWACTLYRRYDGLMWVENSGVTQGTFNWGTIINSTSTPCNWVIGGDNYLKANNTTSCPSADDHAVMTISLERDAPGTAMEGVFQQDANHDSLGDFAFVHSDCDTTPYYGHEVVKWNATLITTNTPNRPGANCDALTYDSTNTTQTVIYDETAPSLAFDFPAAGGPVAVSSAFAGVQFDATDAVAGFVAPNDWELQRQIATWNGTSCGTFANDPAAGSLTTGVTAGADQVVSQSLALGSCYRWTLAATDANGNAATTITSGSIRTDATALLGRQDHHRFETWDLGGGDELAVNVGSGNAVVTHPIVSLPIRGSSMGLSATYNSHDTTNVGLGTGWRLNVQRRLTLNGDGTVLFTDSDGSRHTFSAPVIVGTVTTYTRPATLYATLVKDTSITANEFILTYKDQSKDQFDIAGSEALLVRDEDRHGNGVTVAYGSGSDISTVTDSAGRQVLFTWDTASSPHRLTKIEDWAYVSGGIVQTTATGARRAYRLFYDAGGVLIGWSDPLNTAGSCPTIASHLTCLGYSSGRLATISKFQTVTAISGSVLSTVTRNPITTGITYAVADVSIVKDAEEQNAGSTGTVFSHAGPGTTRVVRQGTPPSTTTYALTSPSDVLGRVGSVKRLLDSTHLEQRTVWDTTFTTEPASVTENFGALLSTPARTTTYTYVAGSLGNVQKVVEPLTASTNRWTEYVYNANNDVTLKTVSLDGSATDRTVTKSCYSTQANSCPTTETGLNLLRQIDRWVSGGASDEDTNVATDFTYDAYGQPTRMTRHNKAPDGSTRDDRADGAVYDSAGNQTSSITNYADGAVTLGTDDISPNATTGARTDLTNSFTHDTAGNQVSSADPRRAIALAATTYARDGFSRTVVDGWGTADTGGAWSSTTADHDVDGSIGTVSLSSNTNRNAYLTSVSAQDQEVLLKVRVDRLAAGSDHLVWVYLRRQDSSNYYQARLSFNTSGTITAYFNRTSAGATTVIDAGTTDIPHATSDWYWMRARISGTSAVRGQVRLWRDGMTEPVTWEVDGTDATAPAALQGTGYVGIRFQLGGSYSGSYPVTASFEEFTVTTIGGGGQALAADDYVTRWTYDGLNAEKTETTPTTPGVSTAQKTDATVYDELGQARHATDFGGVVSGTEFDRAGRATKTFEDTPAAAAAVTSQTTYDAGGHVLTTKDRRQYADAALGSTQYSYDSLGRQLAMANAVGTASATETDTAYDALGRQTSLEVGVASPASQLTTYAYDLGGRTTTTDDGFTCSTATFDYRGLALTTTEGLGSGACTSGADSRTLTNTYDGLGRLTRSQVTAGVGTNDRTVDDTLDAVGNKLTSGILKLGTPTTTTFTVNRLDEVLTESRPDGSTAKTTFDAAGNAADRCFWEPTITLGVCLAVGTTPWTNPPTQSTTTTSDAHNERIGLVDSVTNQTTVYDPDHEYLVKAIYLPTLADLTKEQQSLFGYDDQHRLIEVKHQLCTVSAGHSCSGTSAIGETDYAYDENDNRTQVVESNGTATTDRRYCYDALDRLQYRNTTAACSIAAKDESYAYDDTGNRTQIVVGGVTTNFAYNAEGQLCKVGSTTCTTPNVTYDTAGRTKVWNGWNFTYDAEARLVSACKSATCASGFDKVEFAYDGEGHRTQLKTTSAAGAVSATDFRYQADAIVEEKLTDATHAGVVVRSYVVDDAGTVVKLTIPAGEADAGTYLPAWNGHGDALNLSRLNADGTLTLANSFSYSSWGAPTTATHNGIGNLAFRFLYVGKSDVQWDDPFGLGLTYMHARHYAPSLGRFLQSDPARADENLYGYANASPVTFADCQGTKPVRLDKLSCHELYRRITELAQSVFRRYLDLLYDRNGLGWWKPKSGQTGSVSGHKAKMQAEEDFMKRLIDEYEGRSGSDKCGNFKGPRGKVPTPYKVISRIRVPNPILRPNAPPRPSLPDWRLDEKAALRAVGWGVAGGLLIFMFIRLGSFRTAS